METGMMDFMGLMKQAQTWADAEHRVNPALMTAIGARLLYSSVESAKLRAAAHDVIPESVNSVR